MTSILPQINQLNEIPDLHDYYAKGVLSYINEELRQLDSIEIGVIGTLGGSIISFDTDDSEDTNIELRYKKGKFSLKIKAYSREDYRSVYYYYIPEDSKLYNMIPAKLINEMMDVAMEGEAKTIKEIFKTRKVEKKDSRGNGRD